MAIQVRLDLTPQEFDLMRLALDTFKETHEGRLRDREAPAPVRSESRTYAMRAADLLRKVR